MTSEAKKGASLMINNLTGKGSDTILINEIARQNPGIEEIPTKKSKKKVVEEIEEIPRPRSKSPGRPPKQKEEIPQPPPRPPGRPPKQQPVTRERPDFSNVKPGQPPPEEDGITDTMIQTVKYQISLMLQDFWMELAKKGVFDPNNRPPLHLLTYSQLVELRDFYEYILLDGDDSAFYEGLILTAADAGERWGVTLPDPYSSRFYGLKKRISKNLKSTGPKGFAKCTKLASIKSKSIKPNNIYFEVGKLFFTNLFSDDDENYVVEENV